jgi:hypothetical protein
LKRGNEKYVHPITKGREVGGVRVGETNGSPILKKEREIKRKDNFF